jgi:hypothetical protein
MTLIQYMGRQKLMADVISWSAVVLAVVVAVRVLPHADPRWGRLEAYAVFGAVVFFIARLASRRLLRCPRCNADLSRQVTQILLNELKSCPNCGTRFTDRYR